MTAISGIWMATDTHRRLEVLGDHKVVINWMNGAWEVKGDEHAVPVRCVVDQFVRWFLGGAFRPRTDQSDWCRHIFRLSNKDAETHAHWLMDNGHSGPEAQWEAPDFHDKCKHLVIFCCLYMGPGGREDLVRLLGFCGYGMITVLYEKVSYGGRVEDCLRMGIDNLTVFFPTEVSSFDFQVELTDRRVQYKLDAQYLRLHGLHGDVNDVHRAGANCVQDKTRLWKQVAGHFSGWFRPGLLDLGAIFGPRVCCNNYFSFTVE